MADATQQGSIEVAEGAVVLGIRFSPDGKLFAVYFRDDRGDPLAKVQIYDASSNALVREFDAGPQRVYALAFSPDSASLVCVGLGSGDDPGRKSKTKTFRWP